MKNSDYSKILEDMELPGFKVSHYGEERPVGATDEEAQMFDILYEMFSTSGYDAKLEFVRKSKDYVSAVVGDWDLARFKYTDRAKWIIFPYAEQKAVKHQIVNVDEIRDMTELYAAALEKLAKYAKLECKV